LFCGIVATGSIFFNPSPASAHHLSGYISRSWDTQNGLPQTSAQTVLQSRDGFIWLGTQEGLVRFDGMDFYVFNKKNTPEFRHNDVRALCEARDGRLWIGTANGLLSYQSGRFSTHFLDRGGGADLATVLFEDERATLWIGTNGGGLHRLKDGRFAETLTSREGLASDVVTSVWVDRKGIGWIGTPGGLSRLDGGRISRLTTADGLPDDFVLAVRETSDGGLWVATRRGLARLQDGRFRTYTKKDGLTSDVLNCIYEDRRGGLWLGSEDQGLNHFADGQFSSFGPSDGLSDGNVLSICEDREGLLWVGTYAGGLNRLWKGKFETITTRDGLPAREVRTILESRDGAVWIGTREGGLARLKDGAIVSFAAKEGLPNDTVRALFEDEAGNLWIGTNNGLSRFRDGRFVNYSRRDGLAHDYVRCLAQDRAGRLWVGTSGGGLHLFDKGRLVNYRDKGIPETVIRALTVGKDGSLWIGSNDGLTRLQDGRAVHYGPAEGLPQAPVYVVYEDAEGTIWIGTYGGGLCRLKDGRFSRYTIREGLFDDVVYQILEDGLGDLWMSSNLGIFRIGKKALDDFADGKRARLECVSYGRADGMRSSECNGNAQPAGWKTRDGRLWFPTTEEVVIIEPGSIPRNSLPPLVAFDKIFINRRPYSAAERAMAPPGPGSLEFQFAGLSFIAPTKVLFKYRLEGFDPEWIAAGSRRSAFYTNIPPGSYRFRVQACNNDGLWNETGGTFEFTLKPFFYERKVFYVLAAAALILAGFGANGWRLAKLRSRARELGRLVDVRTRDLAEASRKLGEANKMLEHLARTDPLTGISNRRHFMDVLEVEWRRSLRLGLPLSLIMADIDHFKDYNDAFGHQEGDRCLARLAALLAEDAGRAGDLVGRYGGEEFIVLLPATDPPGAESVTERFRRTSEEARITPNPDVCRGVTLSFGVATAIPKREMTLDALIKAADEALYQAKNEGRNRTRAVRL
jgi:diguanylate cyclase (GGDEF)-like protein